MAIRLLRLISRVRCSLGRVKLGRPFVALGVAIVGVAAGCGSEPTPPYLPPPPPPRPFAVRVVAGGGATDSVDAQLATPLVVEARSDDGQPRAAVPVRFSLVDNEAGGSGPALRLVPAGSASGDTAVTIETDDKGRARAHVVYGRRVGAFRVAVSAANAERGDTTTFTVTPGAMARLDILGPRDTLVFVGRSYAPAAVGRDRHGNQTADAVGLATESPACRVDAARVVGVYVGRCAVAIRAAATVDTVRASIVPSAKLLAVVEGPGGYSDLRLASFGLDGSDYRELAPLTYRFTQEPGLPTRAPDGVRITMHAGVGSSATHITIFDSAGVPRVFSPAGINSSYENWGRFSPDGAWLYFSAQIPAPQGEAMSVWRARPDGSGAERLTPSAPSRNFPSNFTDVTPDGRSLVYVDDQLRLTVMDLTTRATRTLTANGAALQSYALRISPDGARVAFVYDLPNRLGLRLINLDGSGYRILSTAVGYPLDYTPVDWTPDGEWILNRRYRVEQTSPTGWVIDRADWVLVNATTGEILTLPFRVKPTNITIQR